VRFRNFLLSALTTSDLQALMPELTEVSLVQGQILFGPGDSVGTVYFPSSAVVSITAIMGDGRSVESLTVGRESGVALLNAAGNIASQSRIFAQVAGAALRLPATALRRRMAESEAFSALLLRHFYAAAMQTQQFVACNAVHSAEQRLARWLLMTADRTGSQIFTLTQEYMAVMTGVQRTTVSTLATAFRQGGLIRYSRGMVEILDQDGLEAASCECADVAHGLFQGLDDRAGDKAGD
jgi:CRP-like cAMP-binding protein